MGVVASTALYLGSSLTVVGAAPEMPAESRPPSPTTPLAGSAGGWMAEHGLTPTIVVLPSAARPRSLRSIRELVAEEVRRDTVALAGTGGSVAGGTTIAEPDDGTADVNAAVIAAHDERITYLRRQIADFVADGRAAPQIGFLQARLRRAQAARHIATTRSGMAEGLGEPGPAIEIAAVLRAPRVRSLHTSSGADAALPRPIVARLAASRSRQVAGAPIRTVSLQREDRAFGRAVPHASVHGHAPVHASVQSADASHHVRRLLAAARRALEAGDGASTPAASTPVRLAGLMQWEGSDRWSLIDCPTSKV